jgi:thioredoxin reductase (NADPH)
MTGNYHDLLIVGGGMAGLTAAIYGARAGLSVIVLEKEICGGLANWTHVVENFPTHKSIGGMDLMEKVKDQAESCGVTIEEVNEVTSFTLAGRPKKVISDDETHQAGAVILAMGRVPRKLALEDEWEEHVHYCSLCDGSLYNGKRVIVVGGGNSGFDESLYLLGLGVEQITIVEEMQSCIADQATQQKLLATGKVDIHTNTVISAIEPDATGAQIILSNQSTKMDQQINAHGIFVFIGQIPQTECLKGLAELDQQGYIIADSDMHTSLSGVFAAGDVINKKYRQLTTAAADGTIAALEAEKYLRGQA